MVAFYRDFPISLLSFLCIYFFCCLFFNQLVIDVRINLFFAHSFAASVPGVATYEETSLDFYRFSSNLAVLVLFPNFFVLCFLNFFYLNGFSNRFSNGFPKPLLFNFITNLCVKVIEMFSIVIQDLQFFFGSFVY